MTTFKDQWSLEMALEILKSESIDSTNWSEAAKWIMLYGPSDLQEIIRHASNIALKSCFPQLEPEYSSESGEPCYDLDEIAEILEISREEALGKMLELESELGVRHLLEQSETKKIQ